jgi:hypothetical protein
MCSFPLPLCHGLAILLCLAVTTMAPGQQMVASSSRQEKAPPPRAAESPPASVHRMVILEGPNRRVQYITTGNLSTSDRLAAYNLELAENELAYVHDLQQLKQQYVSSERTLEPQRRIVQQQLYGRQVSSSSSSSSYVSYVPNTNDGYPGGLYGYYGAYSPYFTCTPPFSMAPMAIPGEPLAPTVDRRPRRQTACNTAWVTKAASRTPSPRLSLSNPPPIMPPP